MSRFLRACAVLLIIQTASADEARWKEALTLMEVSEPYPAFHIVPEDHRMLRGRMIGAVSVRYEDGSEALFIIKRLAGRKDILEHEAAHFAAWREYGEQINPHGPEWKRWCRERASKPKACKPTDFGRIN